MKKFLSVVPILAAMFIPSTAQAVYESSSDTGTEMFDYIENRRRLEREQRLTEEQQKLLDDIAEAKERLPHEYKEGDPIPAVFEGDDLVYYSGSGEFIATGKVDIIQLEGYRFQSAEATGNTKEQVVRVEGKAHVLQLVPGAPRVTLDGFKTVYNYGKKTGTMGEARGKAGEYYLTGKRFEFYPDHIVVYDGTQTKCGAKTPDYHLSAERMEIWPEQVIKMYNVKTWIKNTVVGTSEYEERKLEETDKQHFPRVGYNKDRGVYIRDDFEFPLMKHLELVIGAYAESKKGFRSNAELQYKNRDFRGKVRYGFYDDKDDKWIQKEPSLNLWYGQHFGHALPLSYGIEAEIGHWRQNAVSSTHQEYEFKLTHDPIYLGKYLILLNTSYKITKDHPQTEIDSGKMTVKGWNYSITVGREITERLAAYVGYAYTKNNSTNSLFDFNTDSYSRKVQGGISYYLTPKDRIAIGVKIDADNHKIDDVDYYWYHDLHCSQAVVRWRGKRKKLEFHWEFIPW
ncbi:MAG: LPS-assembly protein LptD [Selenomonadaceae bacterium]|nr:LPS-assembly protein LptD [Selenomonadaceae bacterium]